MAFDFITREKFTQVAPFALAKPPSWTRLEPVTTTGDPRPGVEARVHDPLWFVGRQWQLGEFCGEDAGTPLTVRVVTNTTLVDRWAVGAVGESPVAPRAAADLLEPLVEREPVPADGLGPGLRARAESGTALGTALEDAGLGGFRAVLAAECPLDTDPVHHPGGTHADLDPAWLRLVRLLGGRGLTDGELVAAALEAAAPGLPAWLVPGDDDERDRLADVLGPWLTWYRQEVSSPPAGTDAWFASRFEYRFAVGAGDRTYAAPAHGGGDIDWHSFDRSADPLGPAEGVEPESERRVHALLASPLRYPGMPVDRLWEMEDAQVNLGVVEAEPWDLARLLVAEFALTYGNDWLVVPVDVPFGSITTVESIVYTTTFGERFTVEHTAKVSPDGRWRMFAITDAAGGTDGGLLVPPGAVAVQDGPAVEEVLFLRDEMANLAWAVERSVQGPSGLARDRAREHDDPVPITLGPVPRAQLDYVLQTTVPARWIPYLPKATGYRAVSLQQGRMPDPSGDPVPPLGRLLADPGTRLVPDSEIPREGVFVRRRPSMTRRNDGTYARWTTRRVGVGRGEGASRLAFDTAQPRP